MAPQWLLSGNVPVVTVLPSEEHRAKDILARHIDKDWTLCDAISFVVLDARRVSRAFTFDHLCLPESPSAPDPDTPTITAGRASIGCGSWRTR